jgi:hypothetical protein
MRQRQQTRHAWPRYTASGIACCGSMRCAFVFSAQRPARDRALIRIPDSPPRRAALCTESGRVDARYFHG